MNTKIQKITFDNTEYILKDVHESCGCDYCSTEHITAFVLEPITEEFYLILISKYNLSILDIKKI